MLLWIIVECISHCLWDSVFVFVLICITMCSFCFVKDERADCLAFVVLRMSCYCKCYVALPHGTVSWSAVCSFL